jgi:hypothetical protein
MPSRHEFFGDFCVMMAAGVWLLRQLAARLN